MNAALMCMLELTNRGVRVWPEGGDLRYRRPQGALTPALREVVSRHKAEILDAFEQGLIEFVTCPGDECGETLMLLEGVGYCNHHQMTVRFVDELAF